MAPTFSQTQEHAAGQFGAAIANVTPDVIGAEDLWKAPVDRLLRGLGTSAAGLDTAAARSRLVDYGPNDAAAEISLVGTIDGHGDASEQVFIDACVNSRFESGMKSPLDGAIVGDRPFDIAA